MVKFTEKQEELINSASVIAAIIGQMKEVLPEIDETVYIVGQNPPQQDKTNKEDVERFLQKFVSDKSEKVSTLARQFENEIKKFIVAYRTCSGYEVAEEDGKKEDNCGTCAGGCCKTKNIVNIAANG